MTPELFIAALIAAAAGAVIAWLFATRRVGALGAELASARERGDTHRAMLDAVSRERDEHLAAHHRYRPDAERLPGLTAALDAARAELTELHKVRAAYERGEAERARAHEAQLASLRDIEAKMEARFGDLARGAIDAAHTQFIERAEARFKASEVATGAKLDSLLTPVHDRLRQYEEHVSKAEAERRDALGVLTGQIEAMRGQNERVSAEAAKLVNALRNAPKARGRWGEQQLRNVLETCGLSEHADFATEVSVTDDDGQRLRPDVTIRIPGGRTLVIDAKVSLNAYGDAAGATDEEARRVHMSAHVAAMRAHVNTLGRKDYQARFAGSADYVVMFVPGEHFVSAALDHDPTLWDDALERKVLIATPTNLIAIARTVSAVWRQEKIARDAAEIGRLGKELYARLATMGGHVSRMGRNLETAVNAYNQFVGSLESQVMTSAKRFETLDLSGAREIEPLPMIEAAARPLAKLSGGAANEG